MWANESARAVQYPDDTRMTARGKDPPAAGIIGIQLFEG